MTFIWLTLLLILPNAASAQQHTPTPDSAYIKNTYEIIQLCFNASEKVGGSKLFAKPLQVPPISDSIFLMLVDKGLIDETDMPYLKAQMQKAPIRQWDPSQLRGIELQRNSKRRPGRNTYGASVPLYSKDRKLALLYVRYLGPDMVHEEILMYQQVAQHWVYSKSVYSVIGG